MPGTDGFAGRHVVVTGGTGALGSAVVGLLLKAGAVCHVPCHNSNELKHFPHANDPNTHIADGLDLTDEGAVEAFYSRFGPGEVVGGDRALWASIHVAGGFAMSPTTQTSKESFLRQFSMNALTCFLCCREAVKRMRAHGGGRIVNVAARPGLAPDLGAGMVAYTVGKASVVALTRSLAAEVAAEGIWVNAVAPSTMDTPANRAAMPDADHASWPSVEDVAHTILFLASPENRAARGGVVPVYGRA